MRLFQKCRKIWIVFALLYGAFLLGVSYFSHPNPPQLVTLNVKSIVTHFSNALAENEHLTSTQKEAVAEDFSKALQSEIQHYQMTHHVVILENTAVMSGAMDITSTIQNRVSIDLEKML